MEHTEALICSVLRTRFFSDPALMHSYPNCRPINATFVPDIRQLAELYQKWSYDFRVILLDRSPEAIMRSSLKRKFDKQLLEECKQYIFTMKSLLVQIKALDPKFIAGGVSIERSLDGNMRAAFEFLAPNLNLNETEVRIFFTSFNNIYY